MAAWAASVWVKERKPQPREREVEGSVRTRGGEDGTEGGEMMAEVRVSPVQRETSDVPEDSRGEGVSEGEGVGG